MESLWPLIRCWAVLGSCVGLSSGCSTVPWWPATDTRVPPMTAPSPPLATVQPAGVVNTPATGEVATEGSSSPAVRAAVESWPSMSKIWSKEKSRPVAEIATAWRNKIEHLPNPAAGGALQPGLAGQVFLYTADAQPAQAQGSLIIDLIDETPRPPGVPSLTPERWEFKKDVLKNLRTLDERFGECYVVFLPWPTYRPDVTHVRLRVCYQPDQGGFPIYAPETRLILGASHGTVSDGNASGSRSPLAETSGGPGMGVFRFGGSVPVEGAHGASRPATPRSGLQVLEITPSVRPPTTPTVSSVTSTATPSPTTPPPVSSPTPPSDTTTPALPVPPLVPGPLPQ